VEIATRILTRMFRFLARRLASTAGARGSCLSLAPTTKFSIGLAELVVANFVILNPENQPSGILQLRSGW
jgi:hypothetical protein